MARLSFACCAAAALITACSSAPRGPSEVVATRNRAAEYVDYGNRSFASGDYGEAATLYQEALALNASVDNEPGVVQCLCAIGRVHIAVRQLAEAEEVLLRASRRAAALADPALEARCAGALAELELERGRPAEARELLARALRKEKELAGTRELAVLYHDLGVAERRLGELDGAQAHLELALGMNRELGAMEEAAANLYALASVHSRRGEYAAALERALDALRTDKSLEHSPGIASDLLALGIISARLGRMEDAYSYLERSQDVYSVLRDSRGLGEVLPRLVEAAVATGRTRAAEAWRAQLDSLGTGAAPSGADRAAPRGTP